jgi:DNA gyrase subunit B
MAKVKYSDDKMKKYDTHTDMIRDRPLMYIGLLGNMGACHCCKEDINNHIDECSKPKSVTPGDTIWIELDEINDCMTTSDNGRGINPNEIVEIFTTLNMGSNTTRAHGYTLGENGVGSLCITAFGRETILKDCRDVEGNIYTYTFREGKLVNETVEPNPDKKHGLIVQYKPSRQIFGKEAHIDVDHMIEWIRAFKYRLNPKITVHLKAIRKGGEVLEETITPVPFQNLITDNNPELMFPVETFDLAGETNEEFGGHITKRTFHLDVAFGYAAGESTPFIASYCNGGHTTDNGHHLDGVVDGITKYLRDQTNSSMSEKEKEKLTIKNEDIQLGMTIAINLMTDMMVLFVGQIKTKLENKKFKADIASAVYEYLSHKISKVTLKNYIDMIKMNAKIRIEASKIRASTVKDQISKWNRYAIEQLIPCASTDKTQTELIICEGLSAKGSLRVARDALYQAIFSVKGFPLNPHGKSVSQIMNNDEYAALVQAMGCGIGPTFDIKKLNYARIIIATDADMDGYGIRSILVAWFLLFFPEIVMEGRLFIADPPLYQIDYKPQEYVTTKKAWFDIGNSIHDKKYVQVEKDRVGEFVPVKNSTLFRDALEFNRAISLANICKLHKYVMFNVLTQIAKYIHDLDAEDAVITPKEFQDMVNNIKFKFTDEYHEIYAEKRDNYIAFAGVYELKYMGTDFTYQMYCRLTPIIRCLIKMKSWNPIYIRDKKSKEVLVGIADSPIKVIETVLISLPKMVDRMKGLGQTDKEILARTTLNITTRTLIQVTIDDYSKALDVVSMLRGDSIADLAERKKMMRSFDIDPDDIDT